MTPKRFQDVRSVFEAALDRGIPDRATFVAEACGDDEDLRRHVMLLIDAHDATVTLHAEPAMRTPLPDMGNREGRRLGEYEIVRQLGRGGMGTVYLARRADELFHKNVAIKISRSDVGSAEVLRRFHQERELLAQLDHPNIARLLDAGETEDGLPYFVMEYVEGRSITEYADHHRLPIVERIALFGQVCDAVDYAHQRKIVHRDLKPGNILVASDSRVKLLDFGIARLIEQVAGGPAPTLTGMWMMTPEYASPEQIRGQAAGRASDIYSLGVILFELLTGHRPYNLRSRIFHEIVRIVCEEPPTLPSIVVTQLVETTTADGKPATLPPETVGRLRQISLNDLKEQLSGDLDNIVLKALDKHPHDRYSSPLQFRADLDRHMSGEPVWARSESLLYQAGRLLSRYRFPLVAAVMLIAAVVSGAIDLRWSVLWWVAGGAALAALWQAATDPKIGRRIAETWVARGGFLILLSATGFSAAFGPRRWAAIFLAINSALALSSIALLFAWFFRNRWAGPLMLDLGESAEARRLVIAFNVSNLIFNVTNIVYSNLRLHKSFQPSELALIFWWIGLMALLWPSSRQEIRRNGFISRGRLIRWSRIASWSWDDVDEVGPISMPGPPRDPILILHLHQRIKFLPPVRFRIGKRQKVEVESILTRQLGEWPAGI